MNEARYGDSNRTDGADTAADIDTGTGTVSGMAAGGPVSKGVPYVVGEDGEELFVPDSAGRIIPNRAFAQTATTNNSRSVTVNVVDSTHRDLQGDIATGLIRGGVTEQVDLIGAY